MPAVERFTAAAPAPFAPTPTASPFQYLVTGDDVLLIEVANTATGARVTVAGRFYRMKERDVLAFTHEIVSAADGFTRYQAEGLGEGYLLNLAVSRSGSLVTAGITYVAIHIARGRPAKIGLIYAPMIILGTLLAGYIHESVARWWPGSSLETRRDGLGLARVIAGTDPASGADVVETVPPGRAWELRAFTCALTTDATPITRTPRLRLDDGATHFVTVPSSRGVPASRSDLFVWGQGLHGADPGDPVVAINGLPLGVRLFAGWRIRTTTANLQAADDYGGVQYLVHEWFGA